MGGEWFREVVDEEIVVKLGEDVEVFFCMSAYAELGSGLGAGSEGAFKGQKLVE